jgi:hypothetical protein
MDLRGTGCNDVDWIGVTQNRDQWKVLVNTIKNIRGPKNIVIFLNSCTTGDFSRKTELHGRMN